MAADEQAAASKPPRTPESILKLPDDRFFVEGGCHALALELAVAFLSAGVAHEIFYLPSREHDGIAEHVVVKCGTDYFDANFGPQSESEVLARWATKTSGKFLEVENPGWISCRSPESGHHSSYLALYVEPTWLSRNDAVEKKPPFGN